MRLTPRQTEAMELLREAKPHSQTGARGFISSQTVKEGPDVFVYGVTARALERKGLIYVEWFIDEYAQGDIYLRPQPDTLCAFALPIEYPRPGRGFTFETQCARCGSSTGPDEDDDLELCLSDPEWCNAHPLEGREHFNHIDVEWYLVEVDR